MARSFPLSYLIIIPTRGYSFGQESDSDKSDTSGVHVVAASLPGSEDPEYDDWADVPYPEDLTKPSDSASRPRPSTRRKIDVTFQRPRRGEGRLVEERVPMESYFDDGDRFADESQGSREDDRGGKSNPGDSPSIPRTDYDDNDDDNDGEIYDDSFRKNSQSSYPSTLRRSEARAARAAISRISEDRRRSYRDKNLRSPSPSSTTDTSSIAIKSTISEDLTRDDRDQGAKLRYLHRQLAKRSLDLRQPRFP